MRKYRVLSLFAGCGAFDLGLERSGGFETVALCEIDSEARATLSARFPGVPQYDDVRTLTADRLHRDGIEPDAIIGGFPCQDVSLAGFGKGLAGSRSGLWSEFARLIGEIGPRLVIVENVTALLGRGFGTVLADLAAIGRDAEWDCLSPCMFGVRQRRDRCFFVAHPHRRKRAESRQRTVLRRQVTPAPFGDEQPVPHGMRVAERPSDRVDIGKRIGACANIAAPQVVEVVARAILSYEMTSSERSGG